jgi:ribonuclease HII
MTRPKPDLRLEKALWEGGYRYVAGIDEAGRGALAGPVTAAAVILPSSLEAARLAGVRDSKLMTPAQRDFWARQVKETALAWAVGYASPEEIDAWGIVPALYLAVQRALAWLQPMPDFLLLDYLRLPTCALPQVGIVRGDQRVLSIAAASVLAKTHRDAWMGHLGELYPQYGLGQHKGYGTVRHCTAIAQYGFSPVHRRTFTGRRGR